MHVVTRTDGDTHHHTDVETVTKVSDGFDVDGTLVDDIERVHSYDNPLIGAEELAFGHPVNWDVYGHRKTDIDPFDARDLVDDFPVESSGPFTPGELIEWADAYDGVVIAEFMHPHEEQPILLFGVKLDMDENIGDLASNASRCAMGVQFTW